MSEHLTNIVVVALIHRDNKIFIARRAAHKSTFPGQFECVGGHLDPGETLEEGLRREVREEIGAEIEVGPLIDAFTYTSEDTFKAELVYLCELVEDQEPVLNPDDHSEFLWLNSSEIDKFEKDDEETAAIRKAFTILEGEE